MRDVDRETPQHKLNGLYEAAPDLIDEMDHVEKLSRQMIQVTPQRLQKIRDLSTFIAIIVCLIMLRGYEYRFFVNYDGSSDFSPAIDEMFSAVMEYLGYLQLLTSITLVIGFTINRGALLIKSGWREHVQEAATDLADEGAREENKSFAVVKAKDLPMMEARKILMTQGPEADEFYVPDGDGKAVWNLGHLALKLEYYWLSLSFVVGNGEFRFLLIYFTLSLQGLFTSPIFYAFHLLDMINRFPTLNSVIQSVTVNGK